MPADARLTGRRPSHAERKRCQLTSCPLYVSNNGLGVPPSAGQILKITPSDSWRPWAIRPPARRSNESPIEMSKPASAVANSDQLAQPSPSSECDARTFHPPRHAERRILLSVCPRLLFPTPSGLRRARAALGRNHLNHVRRRVLMSRQREGRQRDGRDRCSDDV